MLNVIKLVFFFIISIIIVPSKKILVFGDRSGLRFADNSRYLFILMSSMKNFRCIWLTKSEKVVKEIKKKNLECYKSNSLKGIYYSLRAKWHIFNHSSRDISEYFTNFRAQINLWHSTPVKKIDNNNYQNTFLKNLIYRIKKIFFKEYLLLGNDEYSLHLLRHFPRDKYLKLITNLPRNIILNENNNKFDYLRTDYEKEVLKEIKLSKKKVIGYFPTFREKRRELFFDYEDFDRIKSLNDFLKANNLIILFKMHQNSFKEDKSKSYSIDNEKFNTFISKLSNFFSLDYECDLNSILSVCDLLVTDYSGVAFDYLFLDRPIIFYCPDYEEYKTYPGLALDIEKQKFAYFSKNKENFENQLKEFCFNENQFSTLHSSNRLQMLNKIYPKKKFLDDILKIIN